MIELIRAVWLTFLRGKGMLLTGLILFSLWWIVSGALGLEGTMLVNGRAEAIGDGTRAKLALGFGLGCLNLFGMLFVVLQGVALILSDADRGGGSFELTAPIGRGRFLVGRAAGLVLVLAALWAVSLLMLAGAMKWRLGTIHGNLLIGGAIIFLGQILLGSLVLFLRLVLSRGWGELVGLLVWAGSWFLSLDIVEAYLFDVKEPPGGASSWWYPMLEPYLVGAPAGPVAEGLRFLMSIFPPVANVQSVGIDLATGGEVFPALDWRSIPVAAAWCAVLAAGAFLRFRKKELQ